MSPKPKTVCVGAFIRSSTTKYVLNVVIGLQYRGLIYKISYDFLALS